MDSTIKIPTSTIGTQVTEDILQRDLQVENQKEILNKPSQGESWKELGGIWCKDWPDDVTLLSKEGDIVLIADPLNIKPDKMITALEFKFPTLPDLIIQTDREIDFVLNNTKTVRKCEGETEEFRVVYFVPVDHRLRNLKTRNTCMSNL